jgi:hypothetical protein
MEREGRNREICMYLVCDFNGKWLKDSNFLCYIIIILKVEGRILVIYN